MYLRKLIILSKHVENDNWFFSDFVDRFTCKLSETHFKRFMIQNRNIFIILFAYILIYILYIYFIY